jgi:hypothetical protein
MLLLEKIQNYENRFISQSQTFICEHEQRKTFSEHKKAKINKNDSIWFSLKGSQHDNIRIMFSMSGNLKEKSVKYHNSE